jgi:GNAT superfamily N-acetyltransferase
MLAHADLVVTAWHGAHLVGIARTLTDFAYVAYLADLAVDAGYQRRGIGTELIEQTRAELEPTCFLTLLAAPAAESYYAQAGFARNPRAWVLPAESPPVAPGNDGPGARSVPPPPLPGPPGP